MFAERLLAERLLLKRSTNSGEEIWPEKAGSIQHFSKPA